MPKRLISRSSLPDVAQRHAMMRIRCLKSWPILVALLWCSVSLTTPQRALNPLILIWSLLLPETASCGSIAVALDAVRATRAAARREEPEKPRGERKSHGEPDSDIDAVTKGAVDIVLRQSAVKGASECSVEDGRCESECDDEE